MATKAIARSRVRRIYVRPRSRHRSSGFTVPLAALAGLAVGLKEPVEQVVRYQRFEEAGKHLVYNYTGYSMWSGKFRTEGLMRGLVPLALGMFVHKAVGGRLGVNRMLARSRIPVIRI